MPRLLVSNLELERVSEAYPLIRRTARVGPERWEAFCRQLAKQGGGVLAVLAEDRRVHGVAAYLPVASLRHGSALRVEAIAAFELSHVSLVRNVLSGALNELAREKGCEVLMVSLDAKGMSSPRSRRRLGWESLGLTAETIEFVRHLDGEVEDQDIR
ncbi:hypothetical protein LZ518_06030 [Sphingomonas sp. RB56-2]|uniref:N-acetyltransferase domain-containing protein n=1 Tax=Sphingomonas brevis TaxID=2908206 RepID=A0ABT0S985_9SPHN|nr:hypothetical protein [Sphingomonas brevis]MCL6740690.1 hypothetical protein [Sphingomonas brevis]